MRIIEKISYNFAEVDSTALSADVVLLSREDMLKTHRTVTTEGGEKIAISLAEGSHLHDGDVIYMDSDKVVYVSLKEEEIIFVRPKDGIEWAKVAYNIGNMHHQLYLQKDGLYIPYEDHILKVIEKMDVEYEVRIDKLAGKPAAISELVHRH